MCAGIQDAGGAILGLSAARVGRLSSPFAAVRHLFDQDGLTAKTRTTRALPAATPPSSFYAGVSRSRVPRGRGGSIRRFVGRRSPDS
jgi:hypothetical protein